MLTNNLGNAESVWKSKSMSQPVAERKMQAPPGFVDFNYELRAYISKAPTEDAILPIEPQKQVQSCL